MNKFIGKSIFIWNIPACFGGDPHLIAQWLLSHGFESVMVKAADGPYIFYPSWSAFPNWVTSMFRLGRPNIDRNFVDVLHSYGLKVYGWQFNYGRDPEGEGKVAAEQCNSLGLDGWVLDIEGEFEGRSTAIGDAGKWIGKWRQYILSDVPIALCTWAEFYSPRGSQWHNVNLAKFWMSLPEIVCGIPMIYEDVYGMDGKPIPTTSEMMESSFRYVLKQWNSFWIKPIVSAGRAYIGDGGIPTFDSVLRFGTLAREMCAGATYWVMDQSLKLPNIDAALAQTPSWDDIIPTPDPLPEPGRYTGNVLSSATLGLKVRTSPVVGADVGKLSAGTYFEGDTSEIASDGKLWIHITTPLTGWIASWYTNYQDHLEVPPPVEKIPAIPGPFYLLSHREAGEGWFWPNAPLDAYPAAISARGGVGTVTFKGTWLTALRAIMTLLQWNRTWVDQEGWHNSGDLGTVRQVEFAHNLKWVTKINGDGWYEYDTYYLSDPPPNLGSPVDPYRRGIMTVDYKYGHEATGGIANSDLMLPTISIARDRTEKLRINPKYMKSLASLPLECNVKTGGGNLNVRSDPFVTSSNIITSLPDKTPITVFEFQKTGNDVWGRVTSSGSVPGWVSMKFTTWKV